MPVLYRACNFAAKFHKLRSDTLADFLPGAPQIFQRQKKRKLCRFKQLVQRVTRHPLINTAGHHFSGRLSSQPEKKNGCPMWKKKNGCRFTRGSFKFGPCLLVFWKHLHSIHQEYWTRNHPSGRRSSTKGSSKNERCKGLIPNIGGTWWNYSKFWNLNCFSILSLYPSSIKMGPETARMKCRCP